MPWMDYNDYLSLCSFFEDHFNHLIRAWRLDDLSSLWVNDCDPFILVTYWLMPCLLITTEVHPLIDRLSPVGATQEVTTKSVSYARRVQFNLISPRAQYANVQWRVLAGQSSCNEPMKIEKKMRWKINPNTLVVINESNPQLTSLVTLKACHIFSGPDMNQIFKE